MANSNNWGEIYNSTWWGDEDWSANSLKIDSAPPGFAFTGLLDTYTGAVAGFSLRLLTGSYTGSAIRVRRSSDNTEEDIGFNASNELDTAELLSFVGTGGTDDGFVVKWYDQTATADLAQTSAANQPKIVSAGSVTQENGKPTITFDYNNGNALYAEPESWGFVRSNNTSIFMVVDLTQYSTPRSVIYNISGDEVSSGHGDTLLAMARSNQLRIGFHDKSAGSWTPTPDGFYIGVNGFAAQQNLISSIYSSAGALDSYANSTIEGSNPSNPEGSITANKFFIGSNSAGTNPMDGNMQEFILWSSDQTSNRSAIETNINDHFSIY